MLGYLFFRSEFSTYDDESNEDGLESRQLGGDTSSVKQHV